MADEYFVGAVATRDHCGWGTYRRKSDGSTQWVKSPKLPLREKRADAAHDLAVWLAERAPVTRQDRARRAVKLIERAKAADRWAREAYQPGVIVAREHKAQDLRAEAWRELRLGVNEPRHPDLPMPEIDIRALAGLLDWPEDTAEVLAAYGQEEING